jgi:hypothetical protein
LFQCARKPTCPDSSRETQAAPGLDYDPRELNATTHPGFSASVMQEKAQQI